MPRDAAGGAEDVVEPRSDGEGRDDPEEGLRDLGRERVDVREEDRDDQQISERSSASRGQRRRKLPDAERERYITSETTRIRTSRKIVRTRSQIGTWTTVGVARSAKTTKLETRKSLSAIGSR